MGESNKEVYEFLTNRYGDFILLKPPLKINTISSVVFTNYFF